MTNNITPITKKPAKSEKSEKSTKATKPARVEPKTEPMPADRIREIDQAAVADGVTREELERLCVNLTDIVDELGDDATLPEAPDGYERCAECGLPTRTGGNGLCPLHDIHTLVVNEPTAPVTSESSTKVSGKALSPAAVRKLLRERAWYLSRRHGLSLVKPGEKDTEGFTLATDEIGGTVGRVLVGYRTVGVEDPDEQRKAILAQLDQAATVFITGGLQVMREDIENRPYLMIPTTRVPGAEDEKPAKRGPRSGKQAAKWTLPLVTEGETFGSGI